MIEPDLEAMDEATIERFWDLYIVYCKSNAQHPRIKDFSVWYEDNYA